MLRLTISLDFRKWQNLEVSVSLIHPKYTPTCSLNNKSKIQLNLHAWYNWYGEVFLGSNQTALPSDFPTFCPEEVVINGIVKPVTQITMLFHHYVWRYTLHVVMLILILFWQLLDLCIDLCRGHHEVQGHTPVWKSEAQVILATLYKNM